MFFYSLVFEPQATKIIPDRAMTVVSPIIFACFIWFLQILKVLSNFLIILKIKRGPIILLQKSNVKNIIVFFWQFNKTKKYRLLSVLFCHYNFSTTSESFMLFEPLNKTWSAGFKSADRLSVSKCKSVK